MCVGYPKISCGLCWRACGYTRLGLRVALRVSDGDGVPTAATGVLPPLVGVRLGVRDAAAPLVSDRVGVTVGDGSRLRETDRDRDAVALRDAAGVRERDADALGTRVLVPVTLALSLAADDPLGVGGGVSVGDDDGATDRDALPVTLSVGDAVPVGATLPLPLGDTLVVGGGDADGVDGGDTDAVAVPLTLTLRDGLPLTLTLPVGEPLTLPVDDADSDGDVVGCPVDDALPEPDVDGVPAADALADGGGVSAADADGGGVPGGVGDVLADSDAVGVRDGVGLPLADRDGVGLPVGVADAGPQLSMPVCTPVTHGVVGYVSPAGSAQYSPPASTVGQLAVTWITWLVRGASSTPNRENPRMAGLTPQLPLTPMLELECGVSRRYRCCPVKWYVSPRPARTASGEPTSVKRHWHRHPFATVHDDGHVDDEMRADTLNVVPGGYGRTSVTLSAGRIWMDVMLSTRGVPL
jgi:hypothetical protein